jgi:vitamin B12 transporter
VTVITATDIENQRLQTIPDALAAVPGLNVVQTGGPGGQTSVFIRGTNSNQVKVLIDGINVSDPSNAGASFDFGQLLLGDVARIEILRGPQSGLYGSDAVGGVIAITTKTGDGPPKASFTAEGGSFGTTGQHASLSGSQDGFNYAFNVQQFQSISTPVTPSSYLPPGQPANNNSYINWTYSTKLGAKLSDTVAVNLVGRYTNSRLGFTSDNCTTVFPCQPESMPSTQVDHQAFARGEVVWSPFGDGFKNYFGVSYSNLWSWNFDPNADSGYTSPAVLPPIASLGTRTNLNWRGELAMAPGQLLMMGAEDEADTLQTNSSGTVDASYNFTPYTTTAQTGYKAGWLEWQSQLSKQFYVVSNLRYDDYETWGGHFTWRVAPVFIVPTTDTKLKATYGTGFKAPSLYDLYVNLPQYNLLANPNLLPEQSRGWDIGFEQPFFGDRFRVGATYYRNDITDLINTVPTTNNLYVYENVQQATTYGVEAFAAMTVSRQFSVRADYTYTTALNDVTDQALVRRPKNKASLTATWSPLDKLRLTATLLYVGSWWDYARATGAYTTAPAYTTIDLAANYLINDHLTLFTRIDNLFNARYQDPLGFERPGFGIYGGATLGVGGPPATASGLDSSSTTPAAASPKAGAIR